MMKEIGHEYVALAQHSYDAYFPGDPG